MCTVSSFVLIPASRYFFGIVPCNSQSPFTPRPCLGIKHSNMVLANMSVWPVHWQVQRKEAECVGSSDMPIRGRSPWNSPGPCTASRCECTCIKAHPLHILYQNMSALCMRKCLHEARVDADSSLLNAEIGTAQLKML